MRIEKVAAYVRVSTQEQKLHGLSLDAQKMKLNEYAEKHNLKIVEWYMDEGVSGRKLIKNRPELQRMIHDAEKKKFERIIFIKLDRFFRSVAEYHECMKIISPVIWTATEEEYDLSTANGRMLVNMKLTIAELEADQTGERIRLVNDYKLKEGQVMSGSHPFGYKIVIVDGKKKLLKDPETAPIMKDLLNYYFINQNKKQTILYIKEKYDIQFSYSSFARILTNPIICGVNRTNHNFCERYLTEKEFEKLQNILKRNVKNNTAEKRAYLFTGLIPCPECGRLMKGNIFTSKTTAGNVFRYKKYRCGKHSRDGSCSYSKVINEITLERLMIKNISELFQSAKLENAKASKGDTKKKEDISEIQQEMDRLNYSWQKGRIKNAEAYDKQYDKLLARMEAATSEVETAPKVDFKRIEGILSGNWKDIYNALDDAHKRSFWRSFVKSIEVDWSGKKQKDKRITRVNFFNAKCV